MQGCSRAVVLLVVYWATLCASANASRPQHWLETVIAGRSLQQDPSLSNSNGCLGTIPRCEQNACVTRNIQGTGAWACLRCLGTYEAVIDSSGQDNIIQCVCPRGTFENGTSCSRCPTNSYCPGGDKIENPANRSEVITCGPGLVTRNSGARTSSDCVAPAGSAITSPGVATGCSASEYAPMFNRLTKCLICQSGLEEDPGMKFTSAQRSTKRAVCKVPPGRYMSQGLVRVCPQGFYRTTYEDFDAPAAQICNACNPGITTPRAGAVAAAECSVVTQGYGIDNVTSVTAAAGLPALPQDADGLPTAALCGIAYYSAGGFCVQCPSGTVTVVRGSKTAEECVVPPGYFLSAGNMTQCASGNYREGWLLQSDPKASSCTSCGEGIRSEPRDLDQNPLVTDGSLVRATSASCYIEAGQGLISQGRYVFAGRDCPLNTYGVANTIWGLQASPCKPCPRNMITETNRTTTMDACINPAGFGYASEGASRCAPGFYSAKGSMKACTRCPEGRTTQDNPDSQQFIGQCVVSPGFGVASSIAAGNLPANVVQVEEGNVPVSTISAADMQQIASGQCPTGFYGGGGLLLGRCIQCPGFFTTQDPGMESEADCNVCVAGRGVVNGTCELCEYGTYSPGFLRDCITCPSSTFYAPVDGIGAQITSPGTTFEKGATSEGWCVPKESQLSQEAGQAYFSPSLDTGALLQSFTTKSNIGSLQQCMEECNTGGPRDKHCMAQYEETSQTCLLARFQPATDTTTGPQLFYKLPPSALSSASSIAGANSSSSALVTGMALQRALPRSPRVRPGSWGTKINRASQGSVSAKGVNSGQVKAHMLSSGAYARSIIPSQEAVAWEGVGAPLGADARTFVNNASAWLAVTNVVECYELCDNSNVCWGGIFSDSRCLFRGGVDALRTRSFFVLADPGTASIDYNLGQGEYYYTFSSSAGVVLDALHSEDGLTLLQEAVAAALREVWPEKYQTGAEAQAFEQSATDGEAVAQIGFWIFNADGAQQSDLTSIFDGNATTLATVARKVIEAITGPTSPTEPVPTVLDILYGGLNIVSSDTDGNALGSPILADGCALIPEYCGANGAGSCTLSKCSCTTGAEPRCT